jgi:hypothetical protein
MGKKTTPAIAKTRAIQAQNTRFQQGDAKRGLIGEARSVRCDGDPKTKGPASK